MTSSPAYRVCVAQLEKVLSPRVASRSLHAAMRRDGVTPQEATSEQLEPILKEEVFKQLQVAMPPVEARAFVEDLLVAMEAAEADPDAADATEDDPGAEDMAHGASESPSSRELADTSPHPHDAPGTSGEGGAGTPAIAPDVYARLREAARPYNLYFTWPEVRRLRALLARIEDVVEGADDGDAGTLVDEVERSLEGVRQTLEDRLVLQAQELARLEEAFAEVADVGGPKVRRLDNMIKHVREAQADRQLADAELERGHALARELRKAMASSVFETAERVGDTGLDARIKALDVDAELAELDHLARDRSVLLEHRPDLAGRVQEARSQVASGLTLGDELAGLRKELDEQATRQIAEVRRELAERSARLDGTSDAWTPDLRREHAVLVDIVDDDGLPQRADLVRFREQVELALERLRSADERAEAAQLEARASLDLQGDMLARAQQELLRYEDHGDEPGVERLREAVEALRLAQAEERLDREAGAAVREASETLARERRDDDDPSARARAQLSALIDRLAGLPAALDPEGTAELRTDLEAKLDDPPDDVQFASLAAIVSDAVEAAREQARRTMERLSGVAGRWQLAEVLDAIRDANERLEDGGVPGLGDLERRLAEAIETARARQLARLHQLERDARRLVDIDATIEASAHAALHRAREQVDRGEPAAALDEVARAVAELEEVLERRLGDVLPRLDAALATFETVERLNSDEVATVRRILRHLDGQREAFARVSPTLRARMERSLQEAEDLLAELVEEEQATRAIADRLMTGSTFDDLLSGLGGDGPWGAAAEADEADDPDGDDADDWIAEQVERRDVVAAGLLARQGGARRGAGFPDAADPGWVDGAQEVVARLDELGRTLGLGAPRVMTFEHRDRCLLLGHDAQGTVLLAGSDPDASALLVQELRDERWRLATATLDGSAAPGAPHAEADGPHDAG